MKITYTTKDFPLVKVFFNNDPDPDNKSYETFMNYWEENYKNKTYFKMLMDLSNLTKPNLFKLKDFMTRQVKLKENYEQYLKYSVIILENQGVRSILNFLWKCYPPLNTVYLVSSLMIAESLINILDKPINENILTLYMFENNITKVE